MIIGLCGRTGSGKSTVGGYYKSLGINYIDTDLISREVTSKGMLCLDELVLKFGGSILNEDKTLNRRKLAEIAMNDRENYKALNEITHRHIINRTKELFVSGLNIVDAPMLFESGLDNICDTVIGVIADDEICIKRVMKRDNIESSVAETRLKRQKSNDFLKSHCNYIIENKGTKKELIEKAQSVILSIQRSVNA